MCPNLTHLELQMCGRMTDEVLQLLGERCQSLSVVQLHGPYLCTAAAFSSFLTLLGRKLLTLKLSHASKFSDHCLETLSTNCTNLIELSLTETEKVGNNGVIHLKSLGLEKLTLDRIGVIESETFLNLFAAIGSNLYLLSLSHQNNINDDVHALISNKCGKLTHLSLEGCKQSSNESLSNLLSNLVNLTELNISQNPLIEDCVLESVIKTHNKTIQRLNISGLHMLTNDVLKRLGNLHFMIDIDLSWCRDVTDGVIETILRECTLIKSVSLFGCYLLTNVLLSSAFQNKNGKWIRFIGNEYI